MQRFCYHVQVSTVQLKSVVHVHCNRLNQNVAISLQNSMSTNNISNIIFRLFLSTNILIQVKYVDRKILLRGVVLTGFVERAIAFKWLF